MTLTRSSTDNATDSVSTWLETTEEGQDGPKASFAEGRGRRSRVWRRRRRKREDDISPAISEGGKAPSLSPSCSLARPLAVWF